MILGMRTIPVIASILILGSLGLIQDAEAATFTVVGAGGLWSDDTIWSGGVSPGNTILSADTVVISVGAFVTMDSSPVFNFGTISVTGSLHLDGEISNRFGGILKVNQDSNFLNAPGSITHDPILGSISNSGTIIVECGAELTPPVSGNPPVRICDNLTLATCGTGTLLAVDECAPDFAQICGEGTNEVNLQCVITKVARLGWDIVRKFLGFN